ncbi:MAG: sulfurtransferase [Candidatus Calescibacterium sp.]|nr:sulfurtransferase [Candidatus Calescibacterium sp.]MCX7971603.1 sulfurtransferase [bacterium]MDW8195811.1 sulfurtransferase [Candidatus Calescibacterium sp.]
MLTVNQVLVSTDWVMENLNNPNVRIVESSEDVLLYDTGHIPGAVKIDWQTELNDPITRDFIDEKKFEELCSNKGISNDTIVVFYGDKNNWWACYAFWVFKLFEHKECRIMDGGRKKWIQENRPLTKEIPSYPKTTYKANPRNDKEIRAFREEILEFFKTGKLGKDIKLVDVRSPQEYTGELIHMPDYPQEGALRGGHIPTAINIPWGKNVNDDGTFKSIEELKRMYKELGITEDKQIIAYCRIGERSSLTWFVLKYLLGYPNVKNYDGSWTEWGNSVRVPIIKGEQPGEVK